MYRSSPHSTTRKRLRKCFSATIYMIRCDLLINPRMLMRRWLIKIKRTRIRENYMLMNDPIPDPIFEGDEVLVKRMTKTSKLTLNFAPEIFKVIKRKGGDVLVALEESRVKYRRHASHLQHINTDKETSSNNLNKTKSSASSSSRTSSGKDSRKATPDSEPRTKRTTRQPAYLQDYVNYV